MSRLIRCRWPGNSDAPSRGERLPCEYDAYVPDPLVGRNIRLDGDVAADAPLPETATPGLNAQAPALVDTEAPARPLLRAQSMAAPRIEGLEMGAPTLPRPEA